jgi:molecular chaperone GrpE (heat shock protein)
MGEAEAGVGGLRGPNAETGPPTVEPDEAFGPVDDDLTGAPAAPEDVDRADRAEVTAVDPEVPPESEPEPEPEPDPEAEPQPDLAVTVLARLDDLVTAIARVDDRIAERDRLAGRDRDLLDKLHAENQRLRAGESFQVIAPVARDLVRLCDQIRQLDAASPEPGRGDAALIEPQVLGILSRLGVEPFVPEAGAPFDAALHHGVGRTKTADPALDGTVAAVRRDGFTAPDGRPLRPAEVEVWQHVPLEPQPEPEPEPEPDDPGDGSPIPGGN